MSTMTGDAALPTVECMPWCKAGDGHPDAVAVEDQWCGSEMKRVELTAEDVLVTAGRHSVHREMQTLDVYLQHQAYATRSLVCLSHNENPEIRLTADEAIRLGEALITAGRTAGI